MADIELHTLAGRLNRLGYDTFNLAFREARGAGAPEVTLAHWLGHVLARDRSDVALAADFFGCDRARLSADVAASAAAAGPARPGAQPAVADEIFDALMVGWQYATLVFGELHIRTGHLLAGMVMDRKLRGRLQEISPEFRKIARDRLSDEARTVWSGSEEETQPAVDATGPGAAARPDGREGPKGETALARYGQDLTAKAAAGGMDPIVGREEEVRRIVDVLMRRRQNNPILVGEAGVGKTAVVEGLAQLIAAGDVPPKLQGVRLVALDVGLMQAGASMKGEFEGRLRAVIDEVEGSPVPVVLFIDEAHTLIGAGGQAGTGDAANLLKPALARGSLRTIAATTWAEYRQHIEKDPALTRRFQPVDVPEPSVDTCADMLRGLVPVMQRHHGVLISDAALVAAVKLSDRYIPARQLPDKAVSLLDTAAARVAIGQSAEPAAVEDLKARLAARGKEREVLEAERDLGTADEARLCEIAAEIEETTAALGALLAEWETEKSLVEEIVALRHRLREGGGEGDRTRLAAVVAELAAIPADRRLLHAHVDEEAVAAVVSDWTGIPVGRMVRDEVETVLSLPAILGRRVVGQDHGLAMIARRIETSRARLDNPDKPVGVFMLCGPSGVGKTETALALAEALYGGEDNVVTINMSEYQEGHSVASLKGAPPGYVGYHEGGRLTEAVRRRPYSVVLLDEVEKAHPDVHEMFFQVFDRGTMEDASGRRINFRNTLIILTSNVGTDIVMEAARAGAARPEPDALAAMLRPALLEVFPPALLGRIVTIPYYPLSEEMLDGIARLQLGRIAARLKEGHGARFSFGEDVVAHIVAACDDPGSGGRMIDNIVTNRLLPEMSRQILRRQLDGEAVTAAEARVEAGEIVVAVA